MSRMARATLAELHVREARERLARAEVAVEDHFDPLLSARIDEALDDLEKMLDKSKPKS